MPDDEASGAHAEVEQHKLILEHKLARLRSKKNRCLWSIARHSIALLGSAAEGYNQRHRSADLVSHLG